MYYICTYIYIIHIYIYVYMCLYIYTHIDKTTCPMATVVQDCPGFRDEAHSPSIGKVKTDRLYVYTYIYPYIHLSIYLYIYLSISISIYIYIYIYMYISISLSLYIYISARCYPIDRISHKVFLKSFCDSQIPQKSVD